jgi:predicted MFS family arabinose efflux permease
MSAPDAETSVQTPAVGVRPLIAVIAAGIFVTGFGWPGIIARLPFSLLLKNQLHMPAHKVAAFWGIATIAWYIKPLFGLTADAYPIFGTRRRGYLLAGTALSGLFWLAFIVVPHDYVPFVIVTTLLNIAMAFVSTVVGGLQVEVSQRYGATGRLASLRIALEGLMNLLAGPVSGWLAVRAFGWTAVAGACILCSFLPVVAILYREPGGAVRNLAVWASARRQLRVIVGSRAMWGATALLFLVYLAPGFQTPMLYYQQDVLKLDPRFIGFLQLLGGAGGILGALVYGVLCRRLPLRFSLTVGIVLNAASTLLYLRYDGAGSAMVIDSAAAVLGTLATLPLYDMAARATPAGSESFGFALMMSVRNIAIFAISDPLGSYLYDRYHLGFKHLVWLNAGSSAAVLLFVPLLPAALLAAREEPISA